MIIKTDMNGCESDRKSDERERQKVHKIQK